jgi:hypothetical protein
VATRLESTNLPKAGSVGGVLEACRIPGGFQAGRSAAADNITLQRFKLEQSYKDKIYLKIGAPIQFGSATKRMEWVSEAPRSAP